MNGRTLKVVDGQVVIEDNFTAAELAPFTIITHQGEHDVVTRAGLTITAEMRDEQARYSFGRRVHSASVPKYLPQLLPDTWQQELASQYPSKQTRQLVGLIELTTGFLAKARTAGKGLLLHIEQPELYLHPQQQTRVAQVLVAIFNEYRLPLTVPCPSPASDKTDD